MVVHEDDIYDPDRFRRLRPFGPFIDPDTYQMQPTTYATLAVSSAIFGLSMIFAIIAAYYAIQQTKNSRYPLRSVYIWMIWIELVACIVIALECMLFLLYAIRPSFYFFMSILFLWSIQIHLLLQIIINRIRVILHDRAKGRAMIIGVAIFILCINISVFCIWMPARMQISQRYIHINNVWDRVEKGIYLIVDACLNWYFIRTVKHNLIENGLQKYNRLVRFNQRIIVVSLLMDVMIIGAMSIPNGFLYALFHPLAFLVKLNIEMTMANLIRRIALGKHDQNSFLVTFASASGSSSDREPNARRHRRWLRAVVEPMSCSSKDDPPQQEDGIVKTEEYSVVSRRRSQLGSTLFQWPSQKSKAAKRDSLALDAISFDSREMVKQGSGNSGAMGEGGENQPEEPSRPTTAEEGGERFSTMSEDVLIPPAALTRNGHAV